MSNFTNISILKWAEDLNAETYDFVLRNIKSVPGFYSFVKCHTQSNDFLELCKDFVETLSYGQVLNSSIIAHLDFICEIVSKRTYIYPDTISNWEPTPSWAKSLNQDEIAFIDHFLNQLPFLRQYVKSHYEESNLSKLVCDYQEEVNIPFDTETKEGLLLFAIKEKYNSILSKQCDGIFVVDNSKIVNDRAEIETFRNDAEKRFYKSNLEDSDCSDFLYQYIEHFNPYIGFEIIDRLLHLDKVDQALPFLKLASTFIFSTANIYWNNKEAIYGCAIISYSIVELIGSDRLRTIDQENPELSKILFSSAFLLLSRVISWEDYQYKEKLSYSDKLLPINVQHKVRAHVLRSNLIEKYSANLHQDFNDEEYALMRISDEMSTHFWTSAYNIVGENSVFKQRANLIREKMLEEKYSGVADAMRDGLKAIDTLTRRLYIEYVQGKYFLNYKSIKDLFKDGYIRKNTRDLFGENDIRDLSFDNSQDNHLIPYKKDYKAIQEYLEENGIKYFYHFTEISRIESIIKYGGILSYQHCLENNIVIPVTNDMAKTRDIDAEKGLADYARLSFCKRLPKIDVRRETYKDLVLLKISTEVALFDSTEFSDMEATRDEMSHGPGYTDLKKVNIAATQKDRCLQSDPDYWQYQAEILVKGKIPLSCIKNIGNPEII